MSKRSEKAIAIDDLILDERCQVRVELNQEAVEHYAELYKDRREAATRGGVRCRRQARARRWLAPSGGSTQSGDDVCSL